MSLTIDTTVGGTSSNSYIVVADVTPYCTNRAGLGNYDDWAGFSTALKEAAVLEAARRIDRLRFDGTRTKSNQAMKWPRAEIHRWYQTVPDDDRPVLDGNTIPQAVKDAQCEVALAIASDPGKAVEDGLSQFRAISIGGGEVAVTINNDPASAAEVVKLAKRLLRPFLLSQARAIRE